MKMATVKYTTGSLRGQNQPWKTGSVPAGGKIKGMTQRKMLRAPLLTAWAVGRTPGHLGGDVDVDRGWGDRVGGIWAEDL